MTQASAPGKLVLLGEYAVLEGGVALVAAVNRRAQGAWVQGALPPSEVVQAVLAEAGAPTPRGRSVQVDTAGFLDPGGEKLGLGSSAAVAVVTAALASQQQGAAAAPGREAAPPSPTRQPSPPTRPDPHAPGCAAGTPSPTRQPSPPTRPDPHAPGGATGTPTPHAPRSAVSTPARPDDPHAPRAAAGAPTQPDAPRGAVGTPTGDLRARAPARAARPGEAVPPILPGEAGTGDPGDRAYDPVLAAAVRGHRAAAGGVGSGVDVAASFFGGVIACRRQLGPVQTLPPQLAGLHLSVLYTGRPANTRSLVRACRAAPSWAARLARMRPLAEAGVQAWADQDAARFLQVVTDYGAELEALGQDAGVEIVTPTLKAVMQAAAAGGGAAKPSGAGGGDVAVMWAADPALGRAVAAQTGARLLDLAIDPHGLRPTT